VAVIYYALARLSLIFVVQPEGLAVFLASQRVYARVLLLIPWRRWPLPVAGVAVANALANWTGGNPVAVSLGFAFANVFEAVAAAALLVRFIGVPSSISRLRDVVGLTLFGAGAGAALAALAGAAVTSLCFGARYGDAWLAWWVAHGIGMLIVTPLILTVVGDRGMLKRITGWRAVESLALSVVTVALTWVVFGGYFSPTSIAFQNTS